MAWMQRMKMRARTLLDGDRAGDRLTAELDDHIEAQTAENLAVGENSKWRFSVRCSYYADGVAVRILAIFGTGSIIA
jgi:hypothetical protein